MDQNDAKIQSKMSKIESSLLELTNEILSAIKFLLHLKESSAEIVKNLNSITTPEIYLKEFVDVNSFILKYVNFLTEVNCKFEMLEISEKSLNTSVSVNKALILEAGLETVNKTDVSLNTGSISTLNFTKDCEVTPKCHFEKHLKSDKLHSLNISKEKNSENSQDLSSDKNVDNIANNNNNNNKYDYSCKSNKLKSAINFNNDDNILFLKAKLMYSKQADSSTEKISFVDNMYQSQGLTHSYNSGTGDCLKEALSDSEMYVSSTNSFKLSNKEKPKQSLEVQSCTLSDSSSTVSCCKKITEENLVTKAVPINVNKWSHNSNVGKNFNCNEDSDSEIVTSHLKKPTEKKTDMDGIKPANIVRKLGEEYKVFIESIKSPSEFYVSIINDQSNLVDLERKLKSIPKSKSEFCIKRHENKKAWLSKEIGNYALFYSKCDEIWCRAEVTNWCLDFSNDFVNVFLLDYGESKCVSIDDLQPMPNCFKEYPAFAQRCHLHGIFPLDMDQNKKILFWENESTEKMRSVIEKSENLKIRVAANDSFHPITSLPVTLWLVDQNNQCVNQILVESKCALQASVLEPQVPGTKSKYDQCVGDELLNWNPMKEDFECYENCYDLDVNDPAAVIYGYVGNDYKRICSHFAINGCCFKKQSCKKEHQKLDSLGFTTDEEEIYNNAFNIFPDLPSKKIINVQVTCLLTFNQFCCIPADSFYSGEEDLQSLLKLMNEEKNVREMKKLLIPPSAGQLVIAQYSKDCAWYRARILECQPEEDLYTVLFVDYGNKETLFLSNIRAMEARYLHLPFQAMRCFIFGIDRNPEAPLKKVMDYINERIYSGGITIEVISELPGESTNLLVHVFDKDGRNIGMDLINEKFAVYKNEILISSFSRSIPG